MKFQPDFHVYRGSNSFVISFSKFASASTNKLFLGCKPHWSAKRKKTHVRSSRKIKNKLRHWCLAVNFGKFFRTTLLQNTSRRLLIPCTSCRISASCICNKKNSFSVNSQAFCKEWDESYFLKFYLHRKKIYNTNCV